uniref:Longitudinals lacking protein, isoforms H/M/V-like n=1 Tax=Hirondellea gigas TaxID=1518452 RepID=A0A2P2I3W4_9CRUS
MASGLLSLKWNNHRSTFFHVLSTIRSKESYCDVTLACDGRFYSLHKFVLSTCSEYFEEMFERTSCKHPVIVLKDIRSDDLEALLNYMYVGEVNVVQEKLAGLIKAAECLKIKGLAVPDEDPMDNKSIGREQNKRSQRSDDSPRPKRRRRENSSDVGDEILSPIRSRPTARSRELINSSNNTRATKNTSATSEDNRHNEGREHDKSAAGQDTVLNQSENSFSNANRQKASISQHSSSTRSSQKKEDITEVDLSDDEVVKTEPVEAAADIPAEDPDVSDDTQDNKDALHKELGFDAPDCMDGDRDNYVGGDDGNYGGDDDNYGDMDAGAFEGQDPQSVEDVVAQAMPGSSGFQGNSFPLWEGEGGLGNFPEGFAGDTSQSRQMKHSNKMTTTKLPNSIPCSASVMRVETHGPAPLEGKEGGGVVVAEVVAASTIRAHIILNEEAISHLFECDQSGKHLVFRCRICLYTTLKKNNIENHVVTHTDLNAFKCHLCSYKSNYKKDLIEHCNLNHQEASA